MHTGFPQLFTQLNTTGKKAILRTERVKAVFIMASFTVDYVSVTRVLQDFVFCAQIRLVTWANEFE